MHYPAIDEVRIQARKYLIDKDITQKEYYESAGLKLTSDFFSTHRGMRVGTLIAFIKPLGLNLYLNGEKVTTHQQAKRIFLDYVFSEDFDYKLFGQKINSGHWHYLKNYPDSDINYKSFTSLCKKANILVEVK
jgi:hypothetical protein